jgi:hypothetical protein
MDTGASCRHRRRRGGCRIERGSVAHGDTVDARSAHGAEAATCGKGATNPRPPSTGRATTPRAVDRACDDGPRSNTFKIVLAAGETFGRLGRMRFKIRLTADSDLIRQFTECQDRRQQQGRHCQVRSWLAQSNTAPGDRRSTQGQSSVERAERRRSAGPGGVHERLPQNSAEPQPTSSERGTVGHAGRSTAAGLHAWARGKRPRGITSLFGEGR